MLDYKKLNNSTPILISQLTKEKWENWNMMDDLRTTREFLEGRPIIIKNEERKRIVVYSDIIKNPLQEAG